MRDAWIDLLMANRAPLPINRFARYRSGGAYPAEQ
jgi:hypothetical protein